MTRTQIYLPEELLEEAKLHAKLQDKNLSDFIREAIKNFIKNKSAKKNKINPLTKIVGSMHGSLNSDPEAAIKHNDIYLN